MSVIIKGMEMPKNCMDCPFPCVGVDEYYCYCPTRDGEPYDFKQAESIPDDCPLVEISTPHGRLIDERVAYDKIAEQEGGYYIDMDGVDMGLQETPTIIEAEEEQDG